MGSGTTGSAEVLSDRRWAGIELNGDYASEARVRIDESRREAPYIPDEDQETLLGS
ncbi:site-specific DNA-methyltransferase (plasmid) [Haloferax larsenii]|uniref:Site-specific DNA-methyltransferase n=1 Tax=Haloferax larsenii TaxID=302484 RepID=A0ABY5RHY5_HALLR|nr:site-specific DNA-methyltransferase [Haloferax larsenii]UVE51989.1 site-specific DNA-methyltransferase [Haloferax larsenii]